jgi:hypothetical protein
MIPTSSHAACRTPVIVTRPTGAKLYGRVVFVKGRPSTGKAKILLPSGRYLRCPLSQVQIAVENP